MNKTDRKLKSILEDCRTIAMVGVVVAVILFPLLGWQAALGFVIGAVLSGAAGFIGMKVSVQANVRTTQAASVSLQDGLSMAFKSGAVTGLLVVGLALLGVVAYYGLLVGALGYDEGSRKGVGRSRGASTWPKNRYPAPSRCARR